VTGGLPAIVAPMMNHADPGKRKVKRDDIVKGGLIRETGMREEKKIKYD